MRVIKLSWIVQEQELKHLAASSHYTFAGCKSSC